MVFSCEKCNTTFKIDEQRIKPGGSKMKCHKCGHVFKVFPPESSESSKPIKLPDEVLPMHPPMPKPETEPETSSIKQRSSVKPTFKKKYIPFRSKLALFGAVLIGFIAIIVIPIELYRPLKSLNELIDNARNLIGGTQAAFNSEDMDKLNRFALKIILDTLEHGEKDIYYSIAFNMLLIEGNMLPEEAVRKRLENFEAFADGSFSYDRLLEAGAYWSDRFSEEPGTFNLFRNYKQILMKAKENARSAGFQLSEIMIMIDIGVKEGFFKDNIAYVMESVDWNTAPTYCGEPYPVPDELEYWRRFALEHKEGYDNNSTSDPAHWYMPRFDEDEWGAWFSVWLTKETKEIYNIFSIDFNAARVKRLLLIVLGTVIAMIVILAVIVIFITRQLSIRVTKPITELTKGAEQVAKGNYEYDVPVLKEDEFGELTRQFNMMTRGQRERLNLMETLEKFLSKELAEKAAQSGLVLGGQKAECTVMFTDFAGFSTITQKMSAVESVNALNSYYEGLVPIIKKYGGFPDKYIGDAIVALFGAPVPIPNHAERAVACAIEMQWKIREINERRRSMGYTIFEMRIGLNSGDVIAGAIGCDMKLEYTSIGETTNLANRMESICEIGHIMIAEGTYTRIKDIFFKKVYIEETPQQIQVKGYPQPVSTYRIFVDNLEIAKDMTSDAKTKPFYIYTQVDHNIKSNPDEIMNVKFKRMAVYL